MSYKRFGAYLRLLRQKQNPSMTQEQLAMAIGRGKMTISQFESGKNAPPQGELLDKIIGALELTEDETNQLIFLSSEERRTIPGDIVDYFFEHPSICKAIRAGKDALADDSYWEKLSERIGTENV